MSGTPNILGSGFKSQSLYAELRANVGNSVLSIVMLSRSTKVHGVLKAMRKDRPIIPDVQLPVYFKPTWGCKCRQRVQQ